MESHIEMVESSALIIQRKKLRVASLGGLQERKCSNNIMNFEHAFNHVTTAVNMLQRDWTG